MSEEENFETHRPVLLALAYRMLGDMGRAEDMVQEGWIRWQGRPAVVTAPRAFLLTTVTRLCLDELGSARARHEESRGDRLPEPVDLKASGMDRVELMDQVSMAFLLLLQRLTPSERAVFLLHDVFDMAHGEIAAILGKNDAACRQLLSRARQNIGAQERAFRSSPDEHRELLLAFVAAVERGDKASLLELLAEDAVLIADAGPNVVRYGRIRTVGRPVVGRVKIAALMEAAAAQQTGPSPEIKERILNGEPAVVAFQGGRAIFAIQISAAEGKVRQAFLQFDPDRLRHVGPAI
jgi:RNA polymerase sigma-70 factor, ECF subfamily